MNEQAWALACIVVLGLVILSFARWNWLNGKTPRRMGHEDALRLAEKPTERDKLVTYVFPSLTQAVAGLAGIALAVLFVVGRVFLNPPGGKAPEGQTAGLLMAVVALLAMAGVCWIIVLNQLADMLSPSIPTEALIGLYKQSMDLWVFGLILLILALHVAVVLVSGFLAMGIALFTGIVVVRYLHVLHRW